jgi:hypothetical protein
VVDLVEWSDISVFKEFCLDRLAVGIKPDIIAQDVSAFVGKPIGESQVLASCKEHEILDRRKVLLEEVKASAPVMSRELMSVLSRIKKFMDNAENAFDNSDKLIEDFDGYRRSMELQLKAIDTASRQLGALSDSTRSPPSIVISFDINDLRRLEASGAVKIIDAELVGDLLGCSESNKES